MSLPKLTPTTLDDLAFKRFKAVFNLSGAWAIKDDPHTFAKEWLRVLEWCDPQELTRGVDNWIASGKDKWPTPGQLYGVIVESRPVKVRTEAYESPEPDGVWRQITRKDGTVITRWSPQ